MQTLFPKGEPRSPEFFTGNTFLTEVLEADHNNEFSIGSVTFEKGARTNWHTHPKGQVLIVTSGKGWYQERGKPAQAIQIGDVINIPENIEHWHGASADSDLVHLAITNYKDGKKVTWLSPVTDEEYAQVHSA
ncbi:cupin domain-containing protein [Actinobacillus genomosp. 1]|uniref:(R)-mandelonitrile lyase n=1 Tax=Actinobacillus genomosp. 1 TaxID=254839 RepID=UPI0024417547|nr:cupin domain-containing protein [Actinobacillus genomosp. 1]WGE36418.1 cupin domain-containing protein [Actinobacillus genomosp. 1]